MDFNILKQFEQIEPYIDQVNTFADQNKDVFGFLPMSAYRTQALQGRLWVCIDPSANYTGHLLFGGKPLSLSIAQLFVAEPYRRLGVGPRLLRELEAYGVEHDCMSIKARVAADLPANRFWDKQGYRITRQVDGGKTTKRRINVRAKDLDVPSLFDLASMPTETPQSDLVLSPISALETNTYAIDVNVVLDLTKARQNESTIRRLLGFSLYGKGQVCVTSEFISELEKHSASFPKDPLLSLAKALPILPAISTNILSPLVSQLSVIVFPERHHLGRLRDSDLSDLIHLALCIHHQVTGFVTSDKKILRASEELYYRFSIQVLSPDELVSSTISTNELTSKELSVSHEGEQLTTGLFREEDRKALDDFLSRQGFEATERRAILAAGVIGRERTRLVAKYNDTIVGFASWGCDEPSKYRVLYLIVDEDTKFAQSLIDHFIQKATSSLPDFDLTLIALSLPIGSDLARKTALDRGFRKNANLAVMVGECDLVKMSFRGYVTPDTWTAFVDQISSTVDLTLPARMPTYNEFSHTGLVITGRSIQGVVRIPLHDAETLFSPAVFLCDGRDAVIAPIKKQFLEKLLDEPKRQLSLLPSNEALMHVEKAYFKSKRNAQLLKPSQLLFFYVSGSDADQAVIGHGRVTSSRVMDVDSALLKLRRQSALDEKALRQMADAEGKIHAVTFDNFSFFRSPVPFAFLKKNHFISDANLITAEMISYQAASDIIKAGGGGG